MSNHYPFGQVTTLYAGAGVVLVSAVLLFRRDVLHRVNDKPARPAENRESNDGVIVAPTG